MISSPYTSEATKADCASSRMSWDSEMSAWMERGCHSVPGTVYGLRKRRLRHQGQDRCRRSLPPPHENSLERHFRRNRRNLKLMLYSQPFRSFRFMQCSFERMETHETYAE